MGRRSWLLADNGMDDADAVLTEEPRQKFNTSTRKARGACNRKKVEAPTGLQRASEFSRERIESQMQF